MAKKTLIFIVTALAASLLCSCSFVQSAMDEAGLDRDIRDKINTAWDEVAKDGIKTVADEVWREYGLGRSIEWPSKGNGALLPKLRDGKTEFALADEGGTYGAVCISDVSDSSLADYKALLAERGFVETLAACSVGDLYSCDGLMTGFAYPGNKLVICYGNSVEEIDNAYAAAAQKLAGEENHSEEK